MLSFSKLRRLSLKGTMVDMAEDDSDIVLSPSLTNLTLVGVTFLDSRTMHHFLYNSIFSRLRYLSVDAISFIGIDRPLNDQINTQRTKLEEFNLGNVRSSVLRALWSPSSPFDFYTNMKRISIFTNIPGDSADVSLENAEMWESVTHLSFSGWRLNATLFPPHLNASDDDLQISQPPRDRFPSFSFSDHINKDTLNSIMSDFDEDLATISSSLSDLIEIKIRFVLKSEHSGGFALTERLKAMFLKADEAILLRKDQDPQCALFMTIEVREISDTEYRGDLRLGFGFEY
ncbi:hypothetical protein VNI00_000782 [Paramarasmius palmivorus]|uniref:Uncharacterized protein n=1 Tax=Paramarasmius palmivorus TaxID=297713 RepID=A0AAW0E9W0_9AGAR